MTAETPKRSYYPALDGLRGIAILLVLFLHIFDFLNIFFFGWLGVDLFFVLSGFLITDILSKTVDKPFFLRNFYMRRILRIFPLYYITLIICLLILPSIKSMNLDANYYTKNQFWLWAYLQNWLFVFKDPYGDKLLLHTWSLAVEEQFYLLWPFVILLIRKPTSLIRFVIAILATVIIARFVVWTFKIEDLAYASLYTFTRIDGLCVGAILAILLKINPDFLKKYTSLIVFLMALINFGFYFINKNHSNTLPYLAFVGYTTFAVLFGILVYEVVNGKLKIIQFVLDNGFLKFFGKISFGLYVYHWPIHLLLFSYFHNKIISQINNNYRMAEIGSGIIIIAISVLISTISYRYFEKPLLLLKNKYI